MIEYGDLIIDLTKSTYKKKNGRKWFSIDKLPHYQYDIFCTAQYILEEYSSINATDDNDLRYGLSEGDCVTVATKARDYIDDYNVDEEVAISEALAHYKFKSGNSYINNWAEMDADSGKPVENFKEFSKIALEDKFHMTENDYEFYLEQYQMNK